MATDIRGIEYEIAQHVLALCAFEISEQRAERLAQHSPSWAEALRRFRTDFSKEGT